MIKVWRIHLRKLASSFAYIRKANEKISAFVLGKLYVVRRFDVLPLIYSIPQVHELLVGQLEQSQVPDVRPVVGGLKRQRDKLL